MYIVSRTYQANLNRQTTQEVKFRVAVFRTRRPAEEMAARKNAIPTKCNWFYIVEKESYWSTKCLRWSFEQWRKRRVNRKYQRLNKKHQKLGRKLRQMKGVE